MNIQMRKRGKESDAGSAAAKKPADSMVMAVLSWIHVWLMFGGSYFLAAGVLKFSRRESLRYFLDSFWLLLPAALSWFFIRKLRSLAAYLLGSAAAVAVLWFVTGSLQTTALSAAIFLMRCYVRVEKGRIRREMQEMPGEAGAQLAKELWEIPTFLDEPRPVHWALFAVFYVGILLTRRYFMLPWMFYLLLAEVPVCFVHVYLREMGKFIKENQNIANLPINRIRRVGGIILGIALILLAMTVLPSALYGKEPLTDVLDRMDARKISPGELLEDYPMEEGSAMGGEMDLSALAGEYKEPPAWMEALSKAFMFVCSAAIGVGLLIGVYRLCRNTAGYFSQEEEDEVVFLGTDEAEGAGGFFRRRRASAEKRGSPGRRIRRLYKKTIRRKLPERPAGWEAPSELEEKAGLQAGEAAAAFHGLYEKARYSREGCSEEEAERVSSLAGEL